MPDSQPNAGSYFHGDPTVYKAVDFNKKLKKTHGELYEMTMNKEKFVRNAGFTLISIWDSEWKDVIVKIKVIQRHWRKFKRAKLVASCDTAV